MRDRLIELLDNIFEGRKTLGDIADYLIANGVIIPPCGVGWSVYLINGDCVYQGLVKSINVYINTMQINGMYWHEDKKLWLDFTSPLCCFGKDIFLTKEEAERALKEREQV